jgi:hypothetical protein
VRRGTVDGVKWRDLVARRKADIAEPTLAKLPAQLRWMEQRAGRCPFPSYGILALDQDFHYALETQTLALHPVNEQEYVAQFQGGDLEPYMRDEYAIADRLRAETGPVAQPESNDPYELFSDNVYAAVRWCCSRCTRRSATVSGGPGSASGRSGTPAGRSRPRTGSRS